MNGEDSSGFRGFCRCTFPSSPATIEQRFVVLEPSDKAIYIEHPTQGQVQLPPTRISIPHSSFHIQGLGLFCASAEKSQAVSIFFDDRPTLQAFAAQVRRLASRQPQPPVLEAQLGFDTPAVQHASSYGGEHSDSIPSYSQTKRHRPPAIGEIPQGKQRGGEQGDSLPKQPHANGDHDGAGSGFVIDEVCRSPGHNRGRGDLDGTRPSLEISLPQNHAPRLDETSGSSLNTPPLASVRPHIQRPIDSYQGAAQRGAIPKEIRHNQHQSQHNQHQSQHNQHQSQHNQPRHDQEQAPHQRQSQYQPAEECQDEYQEEYHSQHHQQRHHHHHHQQEDTQTATPPETSEQHPERSNDTTTAEHPRPSSLLPPDSAITALPPSLPRPLSADPSLRADASTQTVTPSVTADPAQHGPPGSLRGPDMVVPDRPSFKLPPVSVSRRTLLGTAPLQPQEPPLPVGELPALPIQEAPAKGHPGSAALHHEETRSRARSPRTPPVSLAGSSVPGAETEADTELLWAFLEDRCSEGSDPKGADAAALLLRRRTAGEACSALLLPTVSDKTKLSKVVEEFQEAGSVLVCRTRGIQSDVLISKAAFMRRVFLTGVQDVTYADWERVSLPAVGVGRPPTLRKVNRSAKLAAVLAGMLSDGAVEVAVAGKDGKVMGVLSRDNIFTMAAKEYVAAAERAENGELPVVCDLRQYEDDQEEQEQTLGMPRLRRAAADVLESGFTKTVLGVALLADICVEVYDSFSHFPCVDCRRWDESEAFTDTAESGVPFRSYIDCRERVWLSDCEKIASVTNPINMWAIVSLLTFFLETLLRIFAYRWALVERYVELFDTLVLWLMCATFLALFIGNNGDPKLNTDLRWIIAVARCLRVVRFLRVANMVRSIVGKEKQRYQADGFDLDLSYITDSCIAMSLPATGLEAKFRNPLDEVVRFFRHKHPQRFLIYNLCSERQYSPRLFDGSVVRYPTEDHNPCAMEHICAFVESADRFLARHPDNVIAVHCKGGKGRTGLMIVCWLLYSGFSSSRMKDIERDALEWFALRRTGSAARYKQGVGQPSQRRYITYFNQAMSNGGYRTPWLQLVRVVMHGCPAMDKDGGCEPWMMVEQGGRAVFDSQKQYGVERMQRRQATMEFVCPGTVIHGDVRVSFYDHREFPARDDKMFYLWLHTGFIEDNYLALGKQELDGASRDKHSRVFRNDFRVELFFEGVSHSRVPYRKLERVSRPVLERSRRSSVRMRQALVRSNSAPRRRLALADGVTLSRPTRNDHHLGETRYQDAGFDLDLTYVTDNIIAMAHPGADEDDSDTSRYRSELKRFFLLKHTNAFRVYNLCPGPPYTLETLFPGSTVDVPSTPRHPPPLEAMLQVCDDCVQFLQEDGKNVCVVCSGSGRGRAGVVVACLLLARAFSSSSRHSVEYFNRMRGAGEFMFESPSQVRFIDYCELLLRCRHEAIPLPLGADSVPIKVAHVRLFTTEHDLHLHSDTSVMVALHGPELWGHPAASPDHVMFPVAPSGAKRRWSGSSVPEEEAEASDGDDTARQCIDFEADASHPALVTGNIKLSVMTRQEGEMRPVLSVCLHSSIAGASFANDHDILVLSNSQVDSPEEAAVSPTHRSTSSALPRSFAIRLEIAFSRHPLAGLEGRVHRRASIRQSTSIMSVAESGSVSRVLDLSSSLNHRFQVGLHYKGDAAS